MGKKHRRFKNYTYREISTLILSPKAYEKMYHYVSLANSEVSGFGKVTKKVIEPATEYFWNCKRAEKVHYLIEDIVMLPQTCSGGGTTMDKKVRAKFVVDFIRRHKRTPTEWYLWWHSHYNFGVSWSSIDEAAIAQLLNEGDEKTTILATCMNQQGHIIARRDMRGLHNDALHVSIQPRTSVAKLERYEKEIKEKVKPYKYFVADNDKKWVEDFIARRMVEIQAMGDDKKLITNQSGNMDTKKDMRISMQTKLNGQAQTLYWDYTRRCFVDKDGNVVTYEQIASGNFTTKQAQ